MSYRLEVELCYEPGLWIKIARFETMEEAQTMRKTYHQRIMALASSRVVECLEEPNYRCDNGGLVPYAA